MIAAVVLAVLASVVLAACGSSSTSSTSTSTNASATTPTTSTAPGAPGAARGRFTAIRECLQKNGITLPKRTPGKRPGGGFLGGGAGGGPTLPKGVSKAQYEAAIKKCGGSPRGGFAGGGATAFSSPAAKQALLKFAACMRENGVNVPAPNTSGKGPVFNDKGLDTSSSKFTAAESKCRSVLLSVFRGRPGAAGGSPGRPGAPAGAAPAG